MIKLTKEIQKKEFEFLENLAMLKGFSSFAEDNYYMDSDGRDVSDIYGVSLSIHPDDVSTSKAVWVSIIWSDIEDKTSISYQVHMEEQEDGVEWVEYKSIQKLFVYITEHFKK